MNIDWKTAKETPPTGERLVVYVKINTSSILINVGFCFASWKKDCWNLENAPVGSKVILWSRIPEGWTTEKELVSLCQEALPEESEVSELMRGVEVPDIPNPELDDAISKVIDLAKWKKAFPNRCQKVN